MQEMWVPYLGQEDPLEEGMANHSSILAWKIPWTEEFGAHAHSNMMLFKGGLFGEINDLIKLLFSPFPLLLPDEG